MPKGYFRSCYLCLDIRAAEGLCIDLLFVQFSPYLYWQELVVVFFYVSLRYDMCLREPLLLNCCFLLCRGGVRPMDVVSVTTSPPPSNNSRPAAPRRLFSFLSVAWGFVSDVDIESERCVGNFLKGQFTTKSKIHVFSLTCSAIYQSR